MDLGIHGTAQHGEGSRTGRRGVPQHAVVAVGQRGRPARSRHAVRRRSAARNLECQEQSVGALPHCQKRRAGQREGLRGTRGYFGRASTATRLSRSGCVGSLICLRRGRRPLCELVIGGARVSGTEQQQQRQEETTPPTTALAGDERGQVAAAAAAPVVEDYVRVAVHAAWWRPQRHRQRLSSMTCRTSTAHITTAPLAGQSGRRVAGPQQRCHASRCSPPKCLTSDTRQLQADPRCKNSKPCFCPCARETQGTPSSPPPARLLFGRRRQGQPRLALRPSLAPSRALAPAAVSAAISTSSHLNHTQHTTPNADLDTDPGH